VGALPARAQDAQPGVAHISLIHGDVSSQRGDSGEWGAATLNTPVVAGDSISTGPGARAEVQLDWANILRLDERSVVKVAYLDRDRIQVQVSEGLVSYSMFKGSEASVEIDTPTVSIRPRNDGVYRIQVEEGETLLAVRTGEAEVGTADGNTTVSSGQLITVRGDANSAQFKITDAPGRDGWDEWINGRDQTMERAQNSPNLNRYYEGGNNLDTYGSWRNVPGYGNVWTPTVAGDWAPYSAGSWVWEPYWGWTWVSSEPWGWAPYHYGRWFLYQNSWAWWPGPIYSGYRPLWAPAYVSFFGFGGGFGFGRGFGSIGWLPCGPGDHFHPWYGRGARFGVVNVTNITNARNGIAPLATGGNGRIAYSNVNNLATNPRLRAGLTTVSAQNFGNGRVMRGQQQVGQGDLHQAHLMTGSLPVVPSSASLRATSTPANPASLPSRSLQSQRFFGRSQTAATPRPFTQQAAQVRQQLEQQHAPVITAPSRPSAQMTPNSNGVSRSPAAPAQPMPQSRQQSNGPAGAQQRSIPSQRNQATDSSGWRGFGGNRPQATQVSPQSQERGNQTNGSASRGSGWRTFPPSAQSQSRGESNRGPAASPQSLRDSGRSQSRPPLQMQKPIVQNRAPSYGSSRSTSSAPQRPSYTPSHPESSYQAPQPSRNTPVPHYSAPSAPHGNSGGSNNSGGNRGGGGGSRSGGGEGGSSHSSNSSHGKPPR
jgi:hypothetical protein